MKKVLMGIMCFLVLGSGSSFLLANTAKAAPLSEDEKQLMGEIYAIIKDECGKDFKKCIPDVSVGNNLPDDIINNNTVHPVENEIDLAVKKLHEIGATIFKTASGFGVYNNIRRDEVVKMYVKFAESNEKIKNKVRTNQRPKNKCYFKDSYKAWSDIRPLITKSCQYNLFNGGHGKFFPTSNITNGQAVIVLIRMLEKKMDESHGHYASKYMARAKELGLLEGMGIGMYNVDTPATRGTIAKLLYRSLNYVK